MGVAVTVPRVTDSTSEHESVLRSGVGDAVLVVRAGPTIARQPIEVSRQCLDLLER